MAHEVIARPVAPLQIPLPTTDTYLESLARDHAAACDRFDEADAADAASPDGTPQTAEYLAASVLAESLAGAIAAMPATTIEGIKAKARTLSRYRRASMSAADLGSLNEVESRLASSILNELLTLA